MSSRIDEDREYLIESAIAQTEWDTVDSSAAAHGIPRSTLRSRLQGCTNIHKAMEPFQRLSKEQEEDLVRWILQEEATGRAPSKAHIQGFAQLVVSVAGEEEPIGHNWVDRFLDRHEDVKMKLSRSIEACRTYSTTKEKLEEHIDRVSYGVQSLGIQNDNTYNVDEHGLAEGETRAGRVCGSTLTRYSIVTDSDSRTWATILECISAAGVRLTPALILTGTNLQGQWFPGENTPNWFFDCSPTGWSNIVIFRKWFTEIFLQETRPKDTTAWRMLILDGHRTHITIEIMYMAWVNKVQLIYLPAHSSHISQPLDVGLFSPVKSYFRRATRDFASFNTTAPIQKQRFIEAYKQASDQAFTSRNIRSGFRAAGIFPLDKKRLLDRAVDVEEPPSSLAPPHTPKKRKVGDTELWRTPKSGKDVKEQAQRLDQSRDTFPRDLRDIMNSHARELDRKNTMIAALQFRMTFLEEKLKSKETTGRKAVDYDPNKTFARIPEIAVAHFEAIQAASRYEEAHGPNLYDEAMEIARMEKESMYINFQL
ncbi:hypothetical protein MRS44_013206 [Fusarium solani]|uniref:uncharacterized protein n=1 Tax=Fusarium solani TaxID=169388 RepID=UPI0032C3E584|nr:hypothetical protein MRS44_013206 [Fusarium solani]